MNQVLTDFDDIPELFLVQPISPDQEEVLRALAKESEASPHYTVLSTAKYSLEFTPPGCKVSHVFLGFVN